MQLHHNLFLSHHKSHESENFFNCSNALMSLQLCRNASCQVTHVRFNLEFSGRNVPWTHISQVDTRYCICVIAADSPNLHKDEFSSSFGTSPLHLEFFDTPPSPYHKPLQNICTCSHLVNKCE